MSTEEAAAPSTPPASTENTDDLDWRTNNMSSEAAAAANVQEQASSAADETATSNELNSSGLQESSSNDSKPVETQPPQEERPSVDSLEMDTHNDILTSTNTSGPLSDANDPIVETHSSPAPSSVNASAPDGSAPPTNSLSIKEHQPEILTKQETPVIESRQVQRSVSGEDQRLASQFSIGQANTDAVTIGAGIDPEFEQIKRRVREMEQEADRLKGIQNEVEASMAIVRPIAATSPYGGHPAVVAASSGFAFPTIEEKVEADARSIYVGGIEYHATAEEVEEHFRGCGALNRVTILCDKFTGHPKGYGYIEFADMESVETAMALDGSLLKGRSLKVMPKRTNRPGITTSDRGRPPTFRGRGRGRGFRGRGSNQHSHFGGGGVARGAPGGYIPRGRGFRGRGAFTPY